MTDIHITRDQSSRFMRGALRANLAIIVRKKRKLMLGMRNPKYRDHHPRVTVRTLANPSAEGDPLSWQKDTSDIALDRCGVSKMPHSALEELEKSGRLLTLDPKLAQNPQALLRHMQDFLWQRNEAGGFTQGAMFRDTTNHFAQMFDMNSNSVVKPDAAGVAFLQGVEHLYLADLVLEDPQIWIPKWFLCNFLVEEQLMTREAFEAAAIAKSLKLRFASPDKDSGGGVCTVTNWGDGGGTFVNIYVADIKDPMSGWKYGNGSILKTQLDDVVF